MDALIDEYFNSGDIQEASTTLQVHCSSIGSHMSSCCNQIPSPIHAGQAYCDVSQQYSKCSECESRLVVLKEYLSRSLLQACSAAGESPWHVLIRPEPVM